MTSASSSWDVAELKAGGPAGSPAEAVDKTGGYGALGSTRIHLQLLDLDDPEHLEPISAQVQTQLG